MNAEGITIIVFAIVMSILALVGMTLACFGRRY